MEWLPLSSSLDPRIDVRSQTWTAVGIAMNCFAGTKARQPTPRSQQRQQKRPTHQKKQKEKRT